MSAFDIEACVHRCGQGAHDIGKYVYSTASKRHSCIMRCCVGPQNPSVANDISERAVTVVICFSFSTCCCSCNTSTSKTSAVLARPKQQCMCQLPPQPTRTPGLSEAELHSHSHPLEQSLCGLKK